MESRASLIVKRLLDTHDMPHDYPGGEQQWGYHQKMAAQVAQNDTPEEIRRRAKEKEAANIARWSATRDPKSFQG
jgi:hypothetical protein